MIFWTDIKHIASRLSWTHSCMLSGSGGDEGKGRRTDGVMVRSIREAVGADSIVVVSRKH